MPPARLLEECLDWLCRDQALNNLLITLVHRALGDSGYRASCCLAVARRGDAIAALAWRSGFPKMPIAGADADALEALANAVRENFPDLPGALGPSPSIRAFVAAWLGPAEASPRLGRRQLIYRLDRVTPHPFVPGRLRNATQADLPLVVTWVSAFEHELGNSGGPAGDELESEVRRRIENGSVFIWEDAGAVSLVAASGPPGLVARIGPVFTPPERRRRGYAGAATAAASQLMLDAGHGLCCLYTDAANATSNHIYQEVGYRVVCEVEEYSLD